MKQNEVNLAFEILLEEMKRFLITLTMTLKQQLKIKNMKRREI